MSQTRRLLYTALPNNKHRNDFYSKEIKSIYILSCIYIYICSERESLLTTATFCFLGPESRECDLVFGGVDSH